MIMNSFLNNGSDGCRLQPLIFQGVHASPEKKQHLGKGDERNLETKNQFPGSKLNFGVVHHPIFLLLV